MSNLAEQEPYVSIKDVAQHLSVSTSTIRAWIRAGRIPRDTYMKLGNTYRFRLSDVVDALMEYNDSTEEVEQVNDPETETTEPDTVEEIVGEWDGEQDEDI